MSSIPREVVMLALKRLTAVGASASAATGRHWYIITNLCMRKRQPVLCEKLHRALLGIIMYGPRV